MGKGSRNRQRRRELPPSNPQSEYVRSLDGSVIRGGCEHCNAFQEITADHHGSNVHRITVRHDEWCPVLASLEAQ